LVPPYVRGAYFREGLIIERGLILEKIRYIP